MLTFISFLLVTSCFIALTIWIFASKRNRIHPPLPPGPPGLPIVGNLPFLKPELHRYFVELTGKYGPLFSLQLGRKLTIVLGTPSLAKEVLREFDATFANHDGNAAVMELTYGGADLLCSPYGPKWQMLRKICATEMLGSSSLDAMYNLRKQEVLQTMADLMKNIGRPTKIGEQMFVTVMNIVTSMLWGGTLEEGDRARVGKEFQVLVYKAPEIAAIPNISDFFPVLARFDLQGIVRKMKDIAKKMDGIFEDVIKQRQKMARVDHGKDFLQFLLEFKDRGDPKTPLTIVQVKALLMDMVLAGTDTTSKTVGFAMAEMVNNPQIMKRAQQELETVVGAGKSVEESHIQQLSYLRAIMKETLRLHPTVPLLVPHYPSRTCIVGGYTIPKGSNVFINVWAIHRDPLVWEDPLVFKPERFFDGRYDFSGNDFAYFPFGSGRRICPGFELAERIVIFFLASLLHYFDWKLPEGVEKLDLSEKFGVTLVLRSPLLLVPLPRPSNLRESNPI